MSIRNPVSSEYEAFLRITGIVKSELQDLSEFPDIVLPRAPEVQPDALVGQGKAGDLGRRIREVRMSTYLCAGIRVSVSLSISRYCLSLTPAMLRHSRRAGDFPLRYRDRICRSRLKVQVYTNPHKIFLFFYFFLFLRCLSGYLFFADNHSMYSIGKERCQPPYSDGETPYFSLKHLAKYDAVVKPTLYMTSVTDSLPCAR